ncbi:MAG: cytochrome c-type biogenesis protein [Rhizobiaceae bacterium]
MAAGAAHAVQPDEVLADPALETRARQLSAELRCMVCQNQSIDDSDAELARDLRLLVRKRLQAGDSDQQVIDYLVGRYGEFVLLKPRLSVRNALLWGTPAVLFILAAILGFRHVRRRSEEKGAKPLSDAEKAQLDRILDEAE